MENSFFRKLTWFLGISLFTLMIGGFFLFQRFLSLPPSSLRIAVVDSTRIKNDAPPFLRIRQLLEQQYEIVHREIAKQEGQLRSEYEAIHSSLDPAPIIQKRRHDFEKKMTELQQKIQKKQDLLNHQFSLLSQRLEKTLQEIIQEIVQEKNIQLVLNTQILEKQVVFFSSPSLDITNNVIVELGRRIPNLSLPEILE